MYEDFGHLDGASAYSLDDTASAHSSLAPSHPLDLPPHSHPHDNNDANDAHDLANLALNFDDLSIPGLNDGLDPNGNHVANLYEEDFDGMLDDLNRELPPHACRCVRRLVATRVVGEGFVDMFCSHLLPRTVLPFSLQLLRHSQPRLRRQVPHLFEMVLQLSWVDFRVPHCQPPRASQAQGGDAARREPLGRDDARVLLVRREECLPARVHPRQE